MDNDTLPALLDAHNVPRILSLQRNLIEQNRISYCTIGIVFCSPSTNDYPDE